VVSDAKGCQARDINRATIDKCFYNANAPDVFCLTAAVGLLVFLILY